MIRLAELVRLRTPELAAVITAEQGKTLADAKGDVFRGLEVVETACHVAASTAGSFVENVATDIDTYSVRAPLGVCAGIAPFNFPAMSAPRAARPCGGPDAWRQSRSGCSPWQSPAATPSC